MSTKRDSARLETIANQWVGPGTGIQMLIAQEVNKAIRHCRIGRVVPKVPY